MQKVYLNAPYCLGDDETTIIFTQNATRTIATKENENDEDDNEFIHNEHNETSEYERLSLELAPTFAETMKEMMTLPI